jgi:hypothetical protein
MTTAIEPVEAVEFQEVKEAAGTYQLVALDRQQMESAHGSMIEWARLQLQKCEAEKSEESENLRVASERKWATAPFKKRIGLLDRRITFYQKIRTALELGFVIVPNFEMTVFAIRTNATKPHGTRVERSWGKEPFTQEAKSLPEGEGEYQNPSPEIRSDPRATTDAKGNNITVWDQWPTGFAEIEFPIALAKPVLMNATSQAMAAKVFDEVGVAVDTRWRGSRRGDPIILGRIRQPRANHPDMTFFIGWYFDPSRI